MRTRSSGGGETCGDADHVLLRDPYLHEPLGTHLLEIGCLGGACEVGIEDHDVGPLSGELRECLTVVVALCEFLSCHWITALSSATAFSNSSALHAFPWNPALFSMNETPFPLMVSMMMTVGLVAFFAFSMASMI